jgi:hypothetical protein
MAFVATDFASNSLPIMGASEPKSWATFAAFLTMLIADCMPASAVIGSIISYLPFSIQYSRLFGCTHRQPKPT